MSAAEDVIAIGPRTVTIELRAPCPKCGNPVPVNALIPSVLCPECQHEVHLYRAFWKEVLDWAAHKAAGSSGAYTTSLDSGATLTVDLALLRCSSCETDLSLTEELFTKGPAWIPCSCGALTAIRPVRRDFEPRISVLFTHIIGEDTTQVAGGVPGPAPEAIEPVLFPCPRCGASLEVDGSSRTVKCGYCAANAYLPDDLWRRLHPVKTIERWHLLIDEVLVAEHKKAEKTHLWSGVFGLPGFFAILPASFALLFSDPGERIGALVATAISILLLTVSYWNYEVSPDEEPAKDARHKRRVIPVLLALVAALLAWAAHLAFPRQEPEASSREREPVTSQVPPARSVPAATMSAEAPKPAVRRGFNLNRSAVLPAEVEDDAVPGFVAITFDDAEQTRRYYATAFTADGSREVWQSGQLGANGDHVHVAVAGTKVVVTDSRARAHVLDLRSGSEVTLIDLSDVARRICAHGNQVWVDTVDDKGSLLDVNKSALLRGPRPAWCPMLDERARATCIGALATCASGSTAPAAPGARADAVLLDGDASVAIGVRSPGSARLMAYGFDKSTRAVRWQAELASRPDLAEDSPRARLRADLADGVFAAVYDMRDGSARVAAFDARSGARRWDVEVPGARRVPPASISVTRRRAYVSRWGELHIFDMATGAHVTTKGTW